MGSGRSVGFVNRSELQYEGRSQPDDSDSAVVMLSREGAKYCRVILMPNNTRTASFSAGVMDLNARPS